jgi:hypothetical protein
MPEDYRYGVLITADGVWLKYYDRVCAQYGESNEDLAYATLKYAYFCVLNNAPDVAIDTLLNFVQERNGKFSPQVAESKIYRHLRHWCAKFLGRWRVVPDAQWDEVRSMFKNIFNLDLGGGSEYWHQIQNL